MPSVDDLLGAPAEQKLPTTNDLLDAPPKVDYGASGYGISSPVLDEYIQNSSIGRVLSAFGQNFKEAWGAEPIGLSKEQEDALKQAKMFNDYKDGQFSLIKSFNEVYMRPAAAALDIGLRASSGAFRGLQGAAAQIGEELNPLLPGAEVNLPLVGKQRIGGAGEFARDIAAIPEAFMGTPHPTGTPPLLSMAELERARDLGVIGKGEAGWKGTPEQLDINREAVHRLAPSQEATERPKPSAAGVAPPAVETPAVEPAAVEPAAQDVHAIARDIAPDTFREYDALQTRRDTYRRWIGDMSEELPENPAIQEVQAKIDTILGKVNGNEERLTNAAAERLQQARDELQALPQKLDTPDMTKIRGEMQKLDYQMRDLAPEVSKAYRDAQERVPAETAEATPAERAAATESAATQEEARSGEPAGAGAPAEPPAAPSEVGTPKQAPADIAADISTKLTNAGRPKAEADAAAALIAAHYEARAARFKGTKGTAAELYAQEGPQIRSAARAASVEPVREFAQGEKVSTLKGDEIAAPDTDVKTLRTAARSWYRDNLSGTSVDNPKLGPVEFTRRGLEKAISASANPLKLRLFPALKDIIEKGEIVGSEANTKPENRTVVRYHWVEAPVEIGGETHRVRVALEERTDGKIYYNHTLPDQSYFQDGVPAEGSSKPGGVTAGRTPEKPAEHALPGSPRPSEENIAQNGQKLNLEIVDRTAREFAQLKQTPAFREWFGDSQAVDGAGAPLVVYHGSNKAFSEFKPTESFRNIDGRPERLTAPVHFFAEDKDAARTFAKDRVAVDKNLRGGNGGRAQVRPFYLSVQEPLNFEITPEVRSRMAEDGYSSAFNSDAPNPYAAQVIHEITGHEPQTWHEVQMALDDPRVIEGLRDRGYDGVRLREDDGSVAWGVFDPEQIKATANKGGFDSGSGNVYDQANRGKIAFKNDQAVITLFKDADASTFLHETGHQWLEELMGDARDERAPADLVQDAKTVRDWLGAEEGAAITRRQHEQFARGFERYLMEGRAPSQALARVFAKFRDWLTQIYQTVAKLRSPINDDIRDVFDRLISTNPDRRTVIAPERQAEADFAGRHEDLAARTSPEEAHPVATQVRSEADTHALSNPEIPDVAESIGARASEAGRGNPAEGADADRARAAGRPQPDGASIGAEAGEVRSSGAGTAAEGPAARPRPAVDPNAEVSGAAEAADKAGNIRIDNLNAGEAVNDALRKMARENDDFNGPRRNVVSDQEVQDFADAMGVEAREVNIQKLREMSVQDGIPLAARIVAGRQMMIDAITKAVSLAERAATGSEIDLAHYLEAKMRALMIAETISGITAEMGRGMRAFRKLPVMDNDIQGLIEFMQSSTGKTPKQLRAEAQAMAQMKTPKQAAKLAKASVKPDFWDMFIEYVVNNLISGPATHATYSIGNTVLLLTKAIPETFTEATIGALREHVLGDKGPRVYFGEIGAQLKAIRESGAPVETALKLAHIVGDAPDWKTARTDAYALLRGSRDGVMAAARAAVDGTTALLPGEEAALTDAQMNRMVNPRKAIPNVEIAGKNIPLGDVLRLPSRGVAMIHSYFRAVGYEQAIARLSYRQAMEEGLSGQAFNSRVAELRENPPDEMMAASRHESTEQTLMGKGGEFTQAMSHLMNTRIMGMPLPKLIDPFVHISSNVLEQGLLQRTVLGGIVDSDIRANLLGKNGDIARDIQVARIVTGTAIGLAGFGLAMEGFQNGSGPADPREAALYRRVKGPANSTRIGDMWYDFHRLGTVAVPFTLGANLYETAHLMSGKDFTKAIAQIAFAFSKTILDESGMRGPSDFIQAIEEPERHGAAYVRNQLTSFAIPFSVGMGQEARAIDPYAREVRSITDAIKAKVPWWSETLFPRRDWTGELVPQREALGIDGLSAIYEEMARHDPVEQAMLRLKFYPSLPERKIRGVDLTDQQYDDFSRIAGRMSKVRLDQLVGMPGFGVLPEGEQRQLITNAVSGSREAARSLIIMQNPQILREALDTKVKKITGPAPVN